MKEKQINLELKQMFEGEYDLLHSIKNGQEFKHVMTRKIIDAFEPCLGNPFKKSERLCLAMARQYEKEGQPENASYCLKYARKFAGELGKLERIKVEYKAFPLNISLTLKEYF